MLALIAAAALSQMPTGAPLKNPDVAVHVVERKDYSDAGRRELTLFPAAVQVNGKFTQHFGAAAGFTWHFHENFAAMAMGIWNYVNGESGFNHELSDKTSVSAQTATSLLLIGGALAGVEVTPFYGKAAFFEDRLLHFSIVLNGAAGAGATRHELKPENANGAATYGSTGWRFMAEVGGGVRVKFAQYFSLRLELRDLVYAARVSTVNGCDANDLAVLSMGSGAVSGGCNPTGMSDTDISIARALVRTPSSDVLNNLGVYAGASLDF